jgi:hypothetical protein
MKYRSREILTGANSDSPIYAMRSEETGKQIGLFYYDRARGYWFGVVKHGHGEMRYKDRDRYQVEAWIIHETEEG